MAVIAICYGELAARFPATGAEFLYARHAFGPRTAFLVAWYLALYAIATCAFEAIAFGWLVRTLMPMIALPSAYAIGGYRVTWDALLLGAAGAVTMAFAHLRGPGSASKVQAAITFGFIAVIGVLILMGIVRGSSINLQPLFAGDTRFASFMGCFWILGASTFFLNGWQVALYAIEERREGTSVAKGRNEHGGGDSRRDDILRGCHYFSERSSSMGDADQSGVARSAGIPRTGRPGSCLRSRGGRADLARQDLDGDCVDGYEADCGAVARRRAARGLRLCRRPYGAPRAAIIAVTVLTLVGLAIGRRAIDPIVTMTSICLAMTLMLCLIGVIRLRLRTPAPAEFQVPGGWIVMGLALAGAGTLVVASSASTFANRVTGIPLEWFLLAAWGALGLAMSSRVWRASVAGDS